MSHSKYWLGGRDVSKVNLASKGTTFSEAILLSGLKRAISNFVKIFTKRTIPVMFSSGQRSYTSGKHVVISANTSEKAFDAIVGTSLHESSHIVHDHMLAFLKWFIDNPEVAMKGPLLDVAMTEKGYKLEEVTKIVKHILNVFEDRRIDLWAFRQAPGYRPYYDAMYKAYWESPQIDLGLQSGNFNTPTVGNYLYHVTNMINPWFDTRALPELDEIYGMVDVNKIDRFDSDRWHPKRKKILPGIFVLTLNVAEIIFRNSPERPEDEDNTDPPFDIMEPDYDPNMEPNYDPPECEIGPPSKVPSEDEEEDDSKGGSGSLAGGGGEDDEEEDETAGGNDESEDDSDNEDEDETAGSGDEDDEDAGEDEDEGAGSGDDENEDDSDGDGDEDGSDGSKEKHGSDEKPEADEINEEVLKRAIKRQQDFAAGDIDKQELSPEMAKDIESIDSIDASIEDVDYGGRTNAKVIVIRNISKAVIESSTFPFGSGMPSAISSKAVTNGIRLGKLLAKKLSIRNQTKVSRSIRRKKGHIHRRRLAAIGVGDRSIFYVEKQTKFNPVLLHLTLDASGSMGGEPWERGLGVGVSLAQAAAEIKNLDVVISIRAGEFYQNTATIAIIYDSRKDSMVKIRSLFPLLSPEGNTPEGLCFQALMNELVAEKHGERYFVNVSDGDPWFHDYAGDPAHTHTREQVRRIRGNGLRVMSYYVGGGTDHDGFRKMYGKEAEFIDVKQISGLVRTLNKMFLKH